MCSLLLGVITSRPFQWTLCVCLYLYVCVCMCVSVYTHTHLEFIQYPRNLLRPLSFHICICLHQQWEHWILASIYWLICSVLQYTESRIRIHAPTSVKNKPIEYSTWFVRMPFLYWGYVIKVLCLEVTWINFSFSNLVCLCYLFGIQLSSFFSVCIPF